jgi:hypothetical protein
MELVRPLAVLGSELGQSLLEALLPLIPRGRQLLLQGRDLGVALALDRFDAGFELVAFVLERVARVLDSRLEPGLALGRRFLAFRLQRAASGARETPER